jgi:hypothetical protein
MPRKIWSAGPVLPPEISRGGHGILPTKAKKARGQPGFEKAPISTSTDTGTDWQGDDIGRVYRRTSPARLGISPDPDERPEPERRASSSS